MKKETDLPEEKKQAIRPEELRIGNLALYKGEQITIDGVRLRWMQRCIQSDMPNNMTGIPLSPEWLERLGFKRYDFTKEQVLLQGSDTYVTTFEYGKLTICDWGDGKFILTNSFSFHLRPQITTVHQLQNLIFALTGQELRGVC